MSGSVRAGRRADNHYPLNRFCLCSLDQGKLKEAEEMYQRALAGYEKALGPIIHLLSSTAWSSLPGPGEAEGGRRKSWVQFTLGPADLQRR